MILLFKKEGNFRFPRWIVFRGVVTVFLGVSSFKMHPSLRAFLVWKHLKKRGTSTRFLTPEKHMPDLCCPLTPSRTHVPRGNRVSFWIKSKEMKLQRTSDNVKNYILVKNRKSLLPVLHGSAFHYHRHLYQQTQDVIPNKT